ncbi:MAG: hypothetical protein IH969_02790 [Candidatus Krumholzibacteriota bacterium]|nr:hypothetical protein [Candidatus Krumholzibacteriota bacterium]
MKRLITLSFLGAFLIALPASHVVFSKGHVPSNQVQVCHKGQVIDVDSPARRAHVGHGDCELPACDGANVFHVGNTCTNGDDGSGMNRCLLANDRAQSGSPACADGETF